MHHLWVLGTARGALIVMGKGNFVPIARRCASQSRAGTGIDGATVRAHTRSKSSLFPSLGVGFEFVFIHFESFSNGFHGIWEYLLLFALGPYPPAGAINSVGQDEIWRSIPYSRMFGQTKTHRFSRNLSVSDCLCLGLYSTVFTVLYTVLYSAYISDYSHLELYVHVYTVLRPLK